MIEAPLDTTPRLALDDLFRVEELAAAHPRVLSIQGLRWQLRHRESNGLAQACVRIGNKLLISRSRYEAWLATRVGKSA